MSQDKPEPDYESDMDFELDSTNSPLARSPTSKPMSTTMAMGTHHNFASGNTSTSQLASRTDVPLEAQSSPALDSPTTGAAYTFPTGSIPISRFDSGLASSFDEGLSSGFESTSHSLNSALTSKYSARLPHNVPTSQFESGPEASLPFAQYPLTHPLVSNSQSGKLVAIEGIRDFPLHDITMSGIDDSDGLNNTHPPLTNLPMIEQPSSTANTEGFNNFPSHNVYIPQSESGFGFGNPLTIPPVNNPTSTRTLAAARALHNVTSQYEPMPHLNFAHNVPAGRFMDDGNSAFSSIPTPESGFDFAHQGPINNQNTSGPGLASSSVHPGAFYNSPSNNVSVYGSGLNIPGRGLVTNLPLGNPTNAQGFHNFAPAVPISQLSSGYQFDFDPSSAENSLTNSHVGTQATNTQVQNSMAKPLASNTTVARPFDSSLPRNNISMSQLGASFKADPSSAQHPAASSSATDQATSNQDADKQSVDEQAVGEQAVGKKKTKGKKKKKKSKKAKGKQAVQEQTVGGQDIGAQTIRESNGATGNPPARNPTRSNPTRISIVGTRPASGQPPSSQFRGGLLVGDLLVSNPPPTWSNEPAALDPKASLAMSNFALEITILQLACPGLLPDATRAKIRHLINDKASQGIAMDAPTFWAVLAAKKEEWTAHWNSWSPYATHPTFDESPADPNGDPNYTNQMKEYKDTTLLRFAREAAALEWLCVNLGHTLGRTVVKMMARTVAVCKRYGSHVGGDTAWRQLLKREREEWIVHAIERSVRIDHMGRIYYGVVPATGEEMVGAIGVLEWDEQEKKTVVTFEDQLAEKVIEAYEKVELDLLD